MQTFLLLLGVFACATSVIWIKKSEVDPVFLTGLRLAIAAVALTPVYLRDWRKHRASMRRSHYTDPIVPGLVLAVHFVGWIMGARLTSAVNSTVLVNLVPIAMPFLLVWLVKEKINRQELLATVLAASGLAILFASDYHLSPEYFKGDLVCLGAMLLLALYLALARRYRHHPTIWLYLVPLYYYSAAVALVATPLLAQTMEVDWAREWPWVLAVGLIPTVVGHSLLNNAMRYFRGQVVGLASMLQFIVAGVMSYFMLSEPPPNWSFYPACALILLAGGIAMRKKSSHD